MMLDNDIGNERDAARVSSTDLVVLLTLAYIQLPDRDPSCHCFVITVMVALMAHNCTTVAGVFGCF